MQRSGCCACSAKSPIPATTLYRGDGGRSTAPSGLHRVDGFGDFNRAATDQNRTAFSQLDRRVQAVRLDDAVAADRVLAATIADGALARKGLGAHHRIATIDKRWPKVLEPLAPIGHDLVSRRLVLRHSAASVICE